MKKEKKKKRSKKENEKPEVLKAGGLWVDPMSFPSFDEVKKESPNS